MNFTDNGVTFKDIVNAALSTGGGKIAKGKYRKDASGNIVETMPVVNAIDIDWNKATIQGIDDPITSTGQLLSLIGQLKKAVGNTSGSNTSTILERLSALETAIESGTGGDIPEDLVQQLNALDSGLSSVRSSQQTLGTRISGVETTVNGLNTRFTSVETEVNKFKHVVIEKEDYDRLTSYEPNTLYFIIGEPDYIINGGGSGGGGGESSRINLDAIATNLTINGQSYRNNEIILQPGGVYNVSGTLRGHIIVDTTGYTAAQMKGDDETPGIGNTEIILSNVIINADTDNYGILYKTPEENAGYQDLIVTVQKNTASVIYCPLERAIADDQWGAIHSENNLVVRGPGYLSICNKGGHGIRGTEVEICGPHIYNDVTHDGIHGKRVNYNYGYLYTYSANDAIGSGTNGNINIYGGSFKTETVLGSLFDSKNAGLYNSKISIDGSNDMNNMAELNSVNYATVYNSTNPGFIVAYPNKTSYNSNTNSTMVSGSTRNGVTKYYIDETVGTYIAISGIITNPIEIEYANATNESECTIVLNNAYITTDQNTPTIYYKSTAGKLKIISSKDCANIIINANGTGDFDRSKLSSETNSYEGDCIKSENNIGIEIKNNSHLFISSKFADGVDGDEIKVNDSKGYLLVIGCGQRGLKGNAIVIGPNANIGDSVIGYYYENPNDPQDGDRYRTFEGIAIIKDNCVYTGESAGAADNKAIGFADVYARNGKHKKGVFGTRNKELIGMLMMGSVGAVSSIDMNNAVNLYFNRIVTTSITLTNIPQSSTEADFAKNIYKETIS